MPNHERIEHYLSRLLGYAMSLARHKEDARDLVQECVVRALGAKRVPIDEPAYRAWLFRILRNRFLEKNRSDILRANTIELLVEEPYSDADSVSLLDNILIERALQCLSSDHHEVLALVDIAGFSYAETADLLDVPIGTVMSRISRARSALLEQLTLSQKTGPASKTPLLGALDKSSVNRG